MKKILLFLLISKFSFGGISIGGGGGGGGGGSFTGANLTSGTTGLTVTGGTNAVNGSGTSLTIQTANGSQPGLLSASDWTTFNNKQASGNYLLQGGNAFGADLVLGTTDNYSVILKANNSEVISLVPGNPTQLKVPNVVSGDPVNLKFQAGSTGTTNKNGGDITFAASAGTGTGDGGRYIFESANGGTYKSYVVIPPGTFVDGTHLIPGLCFNTTNYQSNKLSCDGLGWWTEPTVGGDIDTVMFTMRGRQMLQLVWNTATNFKAVDVVAPNGMYPDAGNGNGVVPFGTDNAYWGIGKFDTIKLGTNVSGGATRRLYVDHGGWNGVGLGLDARTTQGGEFYFRGYDQTDPGYKEAWSVKIDNNVLTQRAYDGNTGASFTIRAGNSSSGNTNGGDLTLSGGTQSGTGRKGVVTTSGSAFATTIEYIAATNGGSDTINNNTTHYILDPSSLIAGFTVTMPASPVDGQIVNISGGSFGITSLTLNANTGQSFATGAAISTLAASAFAGYVYRSSNTTWYRTH